jgi:hypothetical protein
MALIVEDGTIVTGAESYISVADADAYFSARGNAAWAALTPTATKEAALRKATDYMTGRYGLRWKGDRVSELQALDWPRSSAYANGFLIDSGSVPVAVQRACAELAVRASSDDLAPDVGAQVKQEVVGPISVTYADGARQDTRYALVDSMLAAYLKGAGQIPVVRS